MTSTAPEASPPDYEPLDLAKQFPNPFGDRQPLSDSGIRQVPTMPPSSDNVGSPVISPDSGQNSPESKKVACTCSESRFLQHTGRFKQLKSFNYKAGKKVVGAAKQDAQFQLSRSPNKKNESNHRASFLYRFIGDVEGTRLMDLESIWMGQVENEDRRKQLIEARGKKAQEYCDKLFGPTALDSRVRMMHYLNDDETQFDGRGLSTIVATTLPEDEESFHLLRSAMLKINMMHLADTFARKINFSHMQAMSEHLRKHLSCYLTRRGDKWILSLSQGNNPEDTIELESFVVADNKDEIAMVRKFIEKDMGTKNMDVNEIQDMIRFRAILTKEDSLSPKKVEDNTEKLISILATILGTDTPERRFRYSHGEGKTNSYSTGKHEAVHVTMRYRFNCDAISTNPEVCPVEGQIAKYMDAEEKEKDHKVYVEAKDKKIRALTGMDLSFDQFIIQLCDAWNSKHDFDDVNYITDKSYEFPLREKLARLICTILIKKDARGNLINEKVIKKLQQDPEKWKKISQLVRELLTYQASHIDFYAQNGSPEEIQAQTNRLQKHSENIRQRMSAVLTSEPETDGIIFSSINYMAAQAQAVLEHFDALEVEEEITQPSFQL